MEKTKRISKKLLALMLVSVLAFSMIGCGGSGSDKAKKNGYADTLNIYMWSEYIPEEIFSDFEKETGIKVVPAYYASNDELVAKVTAGAGSEYDLIQPSLYKMPIMVNGDYVEKLDMKNIPNYKNLDEKYQKVEGFEDCDGYYCVYMTDKTYIAYNEDTCPIEIKSLQDLTDPKLKQSLVFTAGTEIITLGLNALGLDPFTKSEEDYQKAYEWAEKVYPNVKVIDGDSPKSQFMNGEVVAGAIYSGDLAILMDSMDNIKVAEIEEPMASSADVWAIPKGAKHKKEAEAFLNFLLEPENLAKCLDAFPYGSPSKLATEKTGDAYKNNPVHNLGEYDEKGFYVNQYTGMEATVDKLWTKLSAK